MKKLMIIGLSISLISSSTQTMFYVPQPVFFRSPKPLTPEQLARRIAAQEIIEEQNAKYAAQEPARQAAYENGLAECWTKIGNCCLNVAAGVATIATVDTIYHMNPKARESMFGAPTMYSRTSPYDDDIPAFDKKIK